jgi:hypothetical protein
LSSSLAGSTCLCTKKTRAQETKKTKHFIE